MGEQQVLSFGMERAYLPIYKVGDMPFPVKEDKVSSHYQSQCQHFCKVIKSAVRVCAL